MTDEDDHAAATAGHAAPPLVVLVPGLGLDARSWSAVRARMASPTVVVALPSQGLRAAPGADLHVEQQAVRLLEALPRGRDVVLVGHSAGCPVVVDVATRSPRVVGLVLVGPVTDPGARTWPRMLARWLRTARHERPSEGVVLAPQYRATGAGSMLRGMDQMRRYRTQSGLAAVTAPVRVVRGAHDRIAPQDWCDRLAVAGDGVVVVVPGGAHMVPLTHPDAVAASVEALVAGLDRATARRALRREGLSVRR